MEVAVAVPARDDGHVHPPGDEIGLRARHERPEALERYWKAAEMDLSDTWTHSQYGLKYELSPYAGERLKTPFKRLENGSLD